MHGACSLCALNNSYLKHIKYTLCSRHIIRQVYTSILDESHIAGTHTIPQRLHNLNLQMGSIAALQPQDPVFDPDLRLLSVQSFTCSPQVRVSFGFCSFSPTPKNMVGKLVTLNCP